MTLHTIAAVARRRWLWIILPVLILGGGVALIAHSATPMYRSSASLFVALSAGKSATDFNQGASFAQSQMQSYGQLAKMPVVLDPVIKELGLRTTAQKLARQVTATTPQNTTILGVTVSNPSASDAATITSAVARQLVEVIKAVSPQAIDGSASVTATVVQDAAIPQFPYSPKTKTDAIAAALAGLILGTGLAFAREASDTRVRRKEDVEAATTVPVLGEISGAWSSRLHKEPAEAAGMRSEEFGRLRANLQMIGRVDKTQTYVISSAVPGEGKTHIATGAAQSLAAAGVKVLLIDADLRRPAVASRLGMEGNAGLTDCLLGRATFEDVFQNVDEHLTILASGPVPPNPSELLSYPAFAELVAEVAPRFEIILIDAPPLLPVADAVVLSQVSSGVILVADVTRLRRPQLVHATEAIRLGGGRVEGVVLNRTAAAWREGYAYSYSYSQAVPESEQRRPWAKPLAPWTRGPVTAPAPVPVPDAPAADAKASR